MTLLHIPLDYRWSWIITPTWPASIDLPGYGFSLINPLLNERLRRQEGYTDQGEARPIPLKRERLLLHSTSLWVRLLSGFGQGPDATTNIATALMALLQQIRFCSKQATISSGIPVISHYPSDSVPDITWPVATQPGPYHTRRYIFDWAIREEHIRRIATHTEQLEPPISHVLHLDAQTAGVEADYRRSILYAAMAVETGATSKFDALHDAACATTTHNPSLRVRDYPKGGGEIETKDSIYTLLRSRDSFSNLLHEIPLYLTGDSLLLSDAALYQRALTLYRTRNKIAHVGQPPLEQQYLTIDQHGARSAIDTSIALLSWIDSERGYTNPLLLTFASSDEL